MAALMNQAASKQNGEDRDGEDRDGEDRGASAPMRHVAHKAANDAEGGDGGDGDDGVDVARAEAQQGPGANPVRAALLLAGSVRTNQWRKSLGRFFLNLPVSPRQSVMHVWQEQLTRTAKQLGQARLAVRVIVDRSTSLPGNADWNGRCSVGFEQDPVDYRGTGGLLTDLAGDYPDQDYLLVLYGAQVLFEPLAPLVEKLRAMRADVALACDRGGSPLGVMLVRCGSLKVIPPVGYIDLNEQALPMIARRHDVRVWRSGRDGAASIRTLGDYLATVRRCHEQQQGRAAEDDPYRESWGASYSLVEAGAEVAQDAVIHDSVVLAGGRVDSGATLVGSLVCSEGVVRGGQRVVGQIVKRGGVARNHSRRGRRRSGSRGNSPENVL